MMISQIVLATALLIPGQGEKTFLPSEQIRVPAVPNPRPIDEQIEVMRALLVRKLGVAAGGQPLAVFGDAAPYLVGLVEPFAGRPGTADYRGAPPAAMAAVEGVYLDGYGVVFTAMLPATGHDPRPGAPGPKGEPGLSEWEKEQRRLNGEPVSEKTGAPKTPSVGDVLLTMLAENGKHFTSLRDDERVTIAVTFRGAAYTPPLVVTKAATYSAGASANLRGFNFPGTAATPEPQTVRDHELLGDLHLKNGDPQLAIDAFRKALSLAEKEVAQSPADQDARNQFLGALRKLAQANLAAGKDDDARGLMAQAATLESKPMTANPAPKPAAAQRPARLTISASKKLLDQVGSGKMSLEEFRKQATVEYLPAGKTAE